MGQRYTDQELAQSKANSERDDHAHARIDELQKDVALLLAGIMTGEDNVEGNVTDQAAKTLLAHFKETDRRVEKRLGLR